MQANGQWFTVGYFVIARNCVRSENAERCDSFEVTVSIKHVLCMHTVCLLIEIILYKVEIILY